MSDLRRHVFISYNHKDAKVANLVRDELRKHKLDTWLDVEKISPGDRISDKIQKGLSASDYYVILISENSNASPWVKRELSFAFRLSAKKKLALIPLLLDEASVPLELEGLLCIDFRSLKDGLRRLRDFFKSQFTPIGKLDKRIREKKISRPKFRRRTYGGCSGCRGGAGPNYAKVRRQKCENYLRNLQPSELRYLLSAKLTIEQVGVIWFDVFERRMSDEINAANLALCCVELLDRARREEILPKLLVTICRNHSHFWRLASGITEI